MTELVNLLIALLVVGLVFWLVEHILAQIPVSEPFRWVLKVIPSVIALLLVLQYLVPLVHF